MDMLKCVQCVVICVSDKNQSFSYKKITEKNYTEPLNM